MNFIPPSEFGATGYKLQYSEDSGSTWTDYPSGTTSSASQDNIIASDPSVTTMYRLAVIGGAKDGYTSNTVTAEIPTIRTQFTGYSLDESMSISGTMAPWVGRGLEASFTAVQQNYPEDNISFTDQNMTYQWYRVNPVTYEMTAIPGATNLTYITTSEDAGYDLIIRATGDEENISGIMQVMSSWGVKMQNNAYISDVSGTGFTLNLYKTVPGLTAGELSLRDYNGDPVTITGVTQGANGAIYNIAATLNPANGPFYLDNDSDFWSITSSLSGGHMISQSVEVPYSVDRYDITVADVVGGTALVSTSPNIEAAEGETVTVNISAIEAGKQFSSITVTDASSGSVSTTEQAAGAAYTFNMPASAVTVTVEVESITPASPVAAAVIASGDTITINKVNEVTSGVLNTDYFVVATGDTMQIQIASGSTVSITIDSSETVSVQSPSGTLNVTETVSSDPVTVNGSDPNYSFTMPAVEVTIRNY